MHLVVLPHPSVLAPIAPRISPFTFDVVLCEVALIAIAISPSKDTMALLDSIEIVSFKLGSVRPSLYSTTVLGIILPEATI